jgi:uncharacterized protein YyaL (SSP411 family)
MAPAVSKQISIHGVFMFFRFYAAALFLAVAAFSSAQPPKAKPKFTNLLAKETSPYLLMHAHNPTNWHPWGPEAFEKAKKENKLVFLSIGYSSCYWCHVMERESFNNDDVAKILNDSFVCIKVDREERPDIDHIYMTALQTLRGGGGWPLSMFLLPDGRPVVGGTYWPREDKVIEGEKAPGFMSILRIVANHWKDDAQAIEKQAEKMSEATLSALGTGPGIALVNLDKKLVQGIIDDLKEEFDPEYGGFGNPNRKFRGPKFPTPPRLELALQVAQETKDKKLLDMVTLTLDKMAHGGIWDHVGGGFHRYTVERTWTVPHFEKMLYDNAQLVEVYSKAFAATKNPLYRNVVDETLAYVKREMLSPEGAFYSSQDAETHHEEGRFYVWTHEELTAALPDKADRDFVRKVYGANGPPNFEEKYFIFTLPKAIPDLAKEMKLTEDQLSARLAPLKDKLFAERSKRDKPFRNEIALTAWSGQMIAGFAEAGRSLQDKQHLDVARNAADFVLKKQVTPEGRLLRSYGAAPGQKPKAAVNGYLEDYAFFVHGLLTLHEATGEAKWLDASKKLTDVMIQFHADKKGGFYMTASDHEKLFARAKDQYDGAQPSGNSMAARNLVQLWKLTGESKWRDEAERTFKVFAGALKTNGTGLTAMAQGLDTFLVVQQERQQR